jgi:hypothetical protein
MLTQNYHLGDIPYDDAHTMAIDFFKKPEFRNYLKENHPFVFSKMSDDFQNFDYNLFNKLNEVDRDLKISKLANNFRTTTTNEMQNWMYQDFLSKNGMYKVGAEGGHGIIDDIAGHQVFYTLDPKTNQVMRQAQDIWKFDPKKYANKWSASGKSSGFINGKPLSASQKLDYYTKYNQAALLERSGKPFILQDYKPVDLTTSGFFSSRPQNIIKTTPKTEVTLDDIVNKEYINKEYFTLADDILTTAPKVTDFKPINFKPRFPISSNNRNVSGDYDIDKKMGGQINRWLDNIK